MSSILVCWIFQGALLGVAVDDLADGPLFAVMEPLENPLATLVEEVRLVVTVNHLHDLAANARVHLGEANLEPADLATGLATEPLLQFEGVYARGVDMVSGPAGTAETHWKGLSEE